MSATLLTMTITGGPGTRVISISNSDAGVGEVSDLEALLAPLKAEHEKIAKAAGQKGPFTVVTSATVDGTAVSGDTYSSLSEKQVAEIVQAGFAPLLAHGAKHLG